MLDYDEIKEAYVVPYLDYCIDQALDRKYSVGDFNNDISNIDNMVYVNGESVIRFADELKSQMKAKELTQQKLSNISGIPKRTIESWYEGARTPDKFKQQSSLNLIKTL